MKLAKTVKQKQGNIQQSTQLYLNIAEIRDNVFVLKNGGMRAILQVSSINFNLKSEQEQNAIIYAYQGFLNTLDFPVQILVRSRKLDIDTYLDSLNEKREKQTNMLLQRQTFEYIEYIKKLVEYADIMEKDFYVIVPIDPFRTQSMTVFQKFWQYLHPYDNIEQIRIRHREFDDLKKKLTTRLNLVKSGLENCNLRTIQLNTQQLVELFYQVYNPITSRNEKLNDVEKYDLQAI